MADIAPTPSQPPAKASVVRNVLRLIAVLRVLRPGYPVAQPPSAMPTNTSEAMRRDEFHTVFMLCFLT